VIAARRAQVELDDALPSPTDGRLDTPAALVPPVLGAMRPAVPSPAAPGAEPQAPPTPVPQPANAAAARALAFRQLEELLAADESEFALDRGDRASLHEACEESLRMITAGIPRGTLRADDNGVKWAARFCMRHNTAFLRPIALTCHADRVREALVYARMAVETAQEMAPRCKSRRNEAGELITDAKPSSALGPLYGWRRVLASTGRELPPLTMVHAHMKGLVAEFKKRWGARALVPTRRKPFSQQMLRAIDSALRDGAFVLKWGETSCESLRVANCYGLSTGSRADELTHPIDFLRRSAFVFVSPDGEELDMSPASLRQVRDGWLLRGRANASKCDRDNMEWGDRDMWFRVCMSNPLNFAAAWLLWEQEHPCPAGSRSTWAAFSPDGGEMPWATKTLQQRYAELLVLAIGEVEAAQRSWHALRVTAATALNTGKRPDGAIQCVVRWKTLEAMRLYAKMDRSQYADLVDEITTIPIDITKAATNPATDVHDIVDVLDESLEWLSMDESKAAAALLDGVKEPAAASARTGTAHAATPSASAKRGGAASSASARTGKARAATPSASARRGGAASSAPTRPVVPTYVTVLGKSVEVRGVGADKLGVAGELVRVHNSLWPPPSSDDDDEWDPNGTSDCTVVGECVAGHDFGDGRAKPAYIIEDGGDNYPIKESALRSLIGKRKAAKR